MRGKALILVAERDPYAAEFTEHFLRTEGYDVGLAFSAEDALVVAETRPPDLAIVDLLISGAHGQRLCSQLRERNQIPVVAISSLASAEAALAVGASTFLHKPIEPVELLRAVHELLATWRAQHERGASGFGESEEPGGADSGETGSRRSESDRPDAGER